MKLNETFVLTGRQDAETAEDQYLNACRSLLMNIENTFGIRIDGFFAADFNAVTGVVDAMGGVETDIISQEYVDELNRVLESRMRCSGCRTVWTEPVCRR